MPCLKNVQPILTGWIINQPSVHKSVKKEYLCKNISKPMLQKSEKKEYLRKEKITHLHPPGKMTPE